MSIIYDALKKVENKVGQIKAQTFAVSPKKEKNFQVKIFILSLLVLGIGFVMAKMLFSFTLTTRLQRLALPSFNQPQPPKSEVIDVVQEPLEKPIPAEPNVSKSPAIESEPPATLLLNGVFFSSQEGYALINNQILKEGDSVEGAKVMRITLEGVELEEAGVRTKLPISKK
jgi:hypothetical protein